MEGLRSHPGYLRDVHPATHTSLGRRVELRVRLKGLAKTRKKLANGQYRDYYYAWRGGPAIDGTPGTPEFIASYNAAVSARQPPRKGNLASLINSYQDSEAFLGLAAKSKRDYQRILASICKKFGDCPVEVLQDKRVRGDFLAWRDEIAQRSPPPSGLYNFGFRPCPVLGQRPCTYRGKSPRATEACLEGLTSRKGLERRGRKQVPSRS